MNLLGELNRRNVFRVGIAYLVGAWLLAQIADLALDVIGAPDVALRTVMVILALGFIPTPTAIGITAWDLHYDPNWDFLRDNPRFVELATPDNLVQ